MTVKVMVNREDFPKEFVPPGFYPIAVDVEKEIFWNFDKVHKLTRRIAKDSNIQHIGTSSKLRARRVLSLIARGHYDELVAIDTLVSEINDKMDRQIGENLSKIMVNDTLLSVTIDIHLWKGMYKLTRDPNPFRFAIDDFDAEDIVSPTQWVDTPGTVDRRFMNSLCICTGPKGFLKGVVVITDIQNESMTLKILGVSKQSRNTGLDHLYPLYKLTEEEILSW